MQLRTFKISTRLYGMFFLILICGSSFGQHKIHGYVNSAFSTRKIYLSALRYDEKSSIYRSQIIKTVYADSTGYFDFSGDILPESNGYYRLHTNLSTEDDMLELYTSGEKENFRNFIFSNSDTIYFPLDKESILSKPVNTNSSDRELVSLRNYYHNLDSELLNQQENFVIGQSDDLLYTKLRSFCQDSISDPLVRLIAFSYFRGKSDWLKKDIENSNYYNNLLGDLRSRYGEKSYFLQFRRDLNKFKFESIENNLFFYKRIVWMLSLMLVLMTIAFGYILYKRKEHKVPAIEDLTKQEKKIAELIVKGYTNKEIAQELYVTSHTIKSHISKIYSKFDISNRREFIQKYKSHTPY